MLKFTTKLLAGLGGVAAGYWLARQLTRSCYSFADKVVVITGGSRGLGLELVRLFTSEGAKIALCARTGAQVDRAVDELRRIGPEVVGQVCDVTRQQDVEQFVDAVRRQWGRIDVLVNCAGVIQVGPMDCMTVDDYDVSLATHLRGPLMMTNAVLPDMRRQGEGRIVNISSIGGNIGVPHLLPYVAGKFALRGWSQGLAAELAHEGIWVTTVTPGLMRTGSPRNADFKGRQQEEYLLFSISGSLRMTSTDSAVAARRIVEACRWGQPVEMVSCASAIASRLNGLCPATMTRFLGFVSQYLPDARGGSRRNLKGWQSESAWSPSWLTTLNEQAAVRNNEL